MSSLFTHFQEMFSVVISELNLLKIQERTIEYERNETGGSLFGEWRGYDYIVKAVTGPGGNPQRSPIHFIPNQNFVNKATSAFNAYGEFHIGEWHSHHRLGLTGLSYYDAVTALDIVRSNPHLQSFLIIIATIGPGNKVNLRTFGFQNNDSASYSEGIIKVVKETPYNELYLKISHFLEEPTSWRSRLEKCKQFPLYPEGYKLLTNPPKFRFPELEMELSLHEARKFFEQKLPDGETPVVFFADDLPPIISPIELMYPEIDQAFITLPYLPYQKEIGLLFFICDDVQELGPIKEQTLQDWIRQEKIPDTILVRASHIIQSYQSYSSLRNFAKTPIQNRKEHCVIQKEFANNKSDYIESNNVRNVLPGTYPTSNEKSISVVNSSSSYQTYSRNAGKEARQRLLEPLNEIEATNSEKYPSRDSRTDANTYEDQQQRPTHRYSSRSLFVENQLSNDALRNVLSTSDDKETRQFIEGRIHDDVQSHSETSRLKVETDPLHLCIQGNEEQIRTAGYDYSRSTLVNPVLNAAVLRTSRSVCSISSQEEFPRRVYHVQNQPGSVEEAKLLKMQLEPWIKIKLEVGELQVSGRFDEFFPGNNSFPKICVPESRNQYWYVLLRGQFLGPISQSDLKTRFENRSLKSTTKILPSSLESQPFCISQLFGERLISEDRNETVSGSPKFKPNVHAIGQNL